MEHREEHLEMDSGEGSGSIALQSANNAELRLRRPPLVGYSLPATGLTSYSPKSWAYIQQIAYIIVALNVTTLHALRDGYYGSPRIIYFCCDKYEKLLPEDGVEIFDWISEDGGIHFESHVKEYVNDKNREQTMEWLMDTRTSDFYSQLFDIELKKWSAAQAHSALVLKANNLEIPKEYDYCTSYQSYVEHVIANEQERRTILKDTIKRAERFLSSIKAAAENGYLDNQVLDILKLKIIALDKHYGESTMALYGGSYSLFNGARDDWGNYDDPRVSSARGNGVPVAVAREHESNSKALISNLNFIVPTILLLSCIPIALAWTHSPWEVGKSNDANFYQLIGSSLIQLLSLVILLYPTIFHSTFSGHAWLWIWTLAVFSVVCIVLSVLFYVFLPVAWSMGVGFGGMIAQSLIALQVVHAI